MGIRSGILSASLLALAVTATAGELDAGRITAANALAQLRGGTDAVGGVDDWYLSNGVLCAVLTDPSHESDLAVSGGALADLGLCDREDDQFILYQELLNHSLATPVVVERVEASAEAGVATLRTEGGREGVRVETRYSLDNQEPRRLRILTQVTRVADGPRVMGLAGGVANVRSLEPFAVSLDEDRPSRGYVHPSWSGKGPGALRNAALPAELVVAVGPARQEPGVAYGQRLVSATLTRAGSEPEALPAFFLPEGVATILAVFSEPFWFGNDDLGWPELLQSRLLDLEPGSTLAIQQEIWVGERSDAASVTDLLLTDEPLLSGRCDTPACSVHVDRPDGRPFTERRAGAEGRFSLRVPAGPWKLRVRASGGREVQREIEVGPEGRELGTIQVGAAARLLLPRGKPMRLVFLGQDGTPDPNWADDLRGYRLGTNESDFSSFRPLRDLHLSGGPEDPLAVSLAPGRYRVIATRGPEYELSHARLDLAAGSETRLAIAPPERAFETPGWISADLHVHGAASFDTPTPIDVRVASYVAEGAEVLVSSDHENVHDYGPDVVRLGLENRLATVVGLEVTSEVRTPAFPNGTGHANVLPMPRDPTAYRRGAVANENRRWRDILRDLRALPGERLVQLNHARFDEGIVHWRAFLTHMGPANRPYDPTQPLEAENNRVLVEPDPTSGLRDIDFDAIEILNGTYRESGDLLVRDWLSLLVQGERLTATANSDSHTLDSVVAAPRNYVRVADDRIAAFDEGEFILGLREGHACGTNGPWLSLEIFGAGPGDTAEGSPVDLHAQVTSSSWVPVDRLRIWHNTMLLKELPIPANGKVKERLEFDADGLVFVEVIGNATGDYSKVLPGHTPYGFCNPIRVDADSDGTWTPPGLGKF